VIAQNRAVIWANSALKSFVGVPTPSGFDAKSNALNFASSYCRACHEKRSKIRVAALPCLFNGLMATLILNLVLVDISVHMMVQCIYFSRMSMHTCTQTSATSALGIDFVSVWRSSSSFPTINSLTPPSLSCKPPGLKFEGQKERASYYKSEKKVRLATFFCISFMQFSAFTRCKDF